MSSYTRADVSFDSWGDRCAAWLYRPEGEHPVPIVVMAHGFGAVREQALDRYAERFAQAGYAALVFDYRHFGASTGEPRQLLSIGEQLADWAAALGFARTLEGIDLTRLAVWGSSFSGGHVMATAARDHGIAAVIAQVPFCDGVRTVPTLGAGKVARLTIEGLRDAAGALMGGAPHMVATVGPPGSLAVMSTPDAEPGARAMDPAGSSWRNEVAARIALTIALYRPGRATGRITCPLLVQVADEDAITPPQLAVRAAEHAALGELRRYPIGHFDIYLGEAFERAVSDQLDFLERHLAAPAGAQTPERERTPT
jgi:fermentation-respiration switch protein FrsA (DUF1100 family)